jgi:hypothetical protein
VSEQRQLLADQQRLTKVVVTRPTLRTPPVSLSHSPTRTHTLSLYVGDGQTLLRVRLHRDVWVDGSLLAVAWCVVNLRLVDAPIGWLAHVAGARARRRQWVRQLLKAAALAAVFVAARAQAQRYGVHASVGAWGPYLRALLAAVGWGDADAAAP